MIVLHAFIALLFPVKIMIYTCTQFVYFAEIKTLHDKVVIGCNVPCTPLPGQQTISVGVICLILTGYM